MRKIINSILIVFSLFMFNNTIIYANGAPGNSAGLVEGGNIEFKNIKDVNLKQEILDIIIKENQVNVKVEYLLENKGDELETEYIFPVTLRIDEFSDFGSVDNFSMHDGDKELEYSIVTGEKVEVNYEYERTDHYISSLHFTKGETKKLTIEYSVTPEFLDWGTSKSIFTSYGNKYFAYDLSPAANWGNGIIDNFQLSIDVSDVLEKGGSIVDTSFKELDFSESIILYQTENFDILSNSELTIEYEIEDYLLNKFIDSHNAIGKVVKISSSSTLNTEKHGLMNMFDKELKTCWAEGSKGLGVGDWIKVEFSEPIGIAGLLLTNGFYVDESTYRNNSRIKALRVEAEVYDPVNGYKNVDNKNEYPDAKYGSGSGILDIYQPFSELQYYPDLVKSFKVIIEDVYAGENYEDLCISEMMILSYSDLSGSVDTIEVEENVGNIVDIKSEKADIKEENQEQEDQTIESTSTQNSNDDSNNNENINKDALPQTTENTLNISTTGVEKNISNNKVLLFVTGGISLMAIIFIVVMIIKRKSKIT